jgi:hypothetical protein
MFVQFSDSTQKTVIACFANAQDPEIFPNQGELAVSDQRYVSYYQSLSQVAQGFLPAPT